MPIFRVKSVKIYTGQKKIYTDISVGSVTNIRYASFIIENRDIRMTLTTMSIELDVQESAHRVIWAALHQLEYVASIIIIVVTTAIFKM